MSTAVTKQKLQTWFFQYLSSKLTPASGGQESSTTTSDGYQKLWSACASPRTFYNKFTRARTAAEHESCTLRTLCRDNMATFCSGLQGSAEQAAFEFLAVLFCFEGDEGARNFAISSRSFSSYFDESGDDGPASGDEGDGMLLHKAFSKFKKILTQAPLDAEHPSDEEVMPMIEGDDLSETKSKIYQLVIAKRKDKQKFHYLKHWGKKPWVESAEATGIFQRSAFSACGEREAGMKTGS